MKYTYKNITFNLVKLEKALAFQVLEQDESWIGENKKNKRLEFRYKVDGELKIWIMSGTHRVTNLHKCYDGKNYIMLVLREKSFFTINNGIENCFFDSNKQRDIYYNKIIQALKEWDEMVEGLKKEFLTKKENK